MPHQAIIIDGQKYPSVTEVIGCLSKDWKEFWWRKVGFEAADKKSKESAGLGSRCHQLVEDYLKASLKGEKFLGESTRAEVELFQLWLKWFLDSPYELVAMEELVVSKKKLYGGTFDCVLTDGEKYIIADWKFSSNEDPLRPVQLAGYSYAFNEAHEEQITAGLIVRIDPKTKKLSVKEYPKMARYEKAFLILRNAYDIWKGKIK